MNESPNLPLASEESKARDRSRHSLLSTTRLPPATTQQLSFLATASLIPDPQNPRKHSRAQVRALARSIKAFGFNAPILIDRNRQIVSGHGRHEAAKLLGLAQVPVIFLDHLTETQAKAYQLADNKLTDRSTWDDDKVAVRLKELSELVLDFDLEDTGFELPEIDLRVQSLDDQDATDRADEFDAATGPAVSLPGDLWLLGPHRLYCGNALDSTSYIALMNGEKAAAVFTDPPYNVKIDGNAAGISGNITYREFAMASGEMTDLEFTDFLATSFKSIRLHATPGAIIYACMDWRHMWEILSASHTADLPLLNLCVWSKTIGGMGSLYRSRHELVFVFRNGNETHLNNVQLGRFGRNRTNLWTYPGVNGFARKGNEDLLALHPTVKPIALVADAILDCTKRDDIVLDPYLGSGTTILAAERTGRRCFGIEIDPIYVDTAIGRWERLTGKKALNSQGLTLEQVKLQRSADQ
jgi:DNA modification methylase